MPVEGVSQTQQDVPQGRWQRCRRGIAQECQLFSKTYKEVRKDDVFSIRRQVGTSVGIGIVVGASVVIPIYVTYKALHGMTVDMDLIQGVGTGSVMGAVFSTYQTMMRTAVKRWSSEPRPLQVEQSPS